MNNRLHNCKNPYQGKDKRVLCCCSAGLLRSPTTAKVLWQTYGYNTRAVGLDTEHALIPIDTVLIKWAEELVVMNERQKQQVEFMCNIQDFESPPIVVLDIPDSYEYMNPELQELIVEKYKLKKEVLNV